MNRQEAALNIYNMQAVRAIPDVEAEFKSQCDATGWDEESYWTIEEKGNAL